MDDSASSSSSSSSCRSKPMELGFWTGQKEVTRISFLFLGLAASCLLLYKSTSPLQPLDFLGLGSSLSISLEPRMSLKEILGNASTENKTVIITTLNKAWAEPGSLFDLFLQSFRSGQGTRQLLKHVVVVCLDPRAFSRCSKLHPYCYRLITAGTDFSGEKVYMSRDYLKMMWRRIELLTQVLEMGFNFIFTDADIMWLRNPFERLYPEGDLQMACDRFSGDAYSSDNWVNGGFIYVKSNRRTIQFYKLWYESRMKYPGLHDQDVFNRIKREESVSEIGIKMRFFDTVYFGGFCETSRDINVVCTMHANCCVGLKNKLHDLKLVLDDWRNYVVSVSNGTEKNITTTWNWKAPIKCRRRH